MRFSKKEKKRKEMEGSPKRKRFKPSHLTDFVTDLSSSENDENENSNESDWGKSSDFEDFEELSSLEDRVNIFSSFFKFKLY